MLGGAFDTATCSYNHEQEVYTCSNCSAEFLTEQEAETHLLTHREAYTCDACVKPHDFRDPYEFSVHMRQFDDENLFRCPQCSYACAARNSIYAHIKTLHLGQYYYQCDKCGKYFNDHQMYKDHENFHLGIKPFRCGVCGKEFHNNRYLSSHQVRMHTVHIEGGGAAQCAVCGKRFTSTSLMRKHMRNHAGSSGVKRHLCDVCGQGFSRKDKMKIHYRTHTGEKPYACSFCGKSFIKRDYMVMHERTHTGEKPYTCEFCGKSFNQGAPLRIHLRRHTGERPYKCPYCLVGCVSKGALDSHIKSCVQSLV